MELSTYYSLLPPPSLLHFKMDSIARGRNGGGISGVFTPNWAKGDLPAHPRLTLRPLFNKEGSPPQTWLSEIALFAAGKRESSTLALTPFSEELGSGRRGWAAVS